MKKIIWFSNVPFSSSSIKCTGGWLQPMAEGISQRGIYEIVNVSFGNVRQPYTEQIGDIKQWLIPKYKTKDYGQTASREIQEEVLSIIRKETPDLIHVWGTENCWASIFAKNNITIAQLVDIQGVLSSCYYYYYGGLDTAQLIKCIHLKEIIMPWRSLFWKKEIFFRRGQKEIEYLKHFNHISYQSEWVKSSLLYINDKAHLHHTKLLLRKEFYEASPWRYQDHSDSPIIFSSTSAAVTYKGYHRLLHAVALVKKRYPKVQLRIAGRMNVGNKLLDGYSVYLNNLIKEYGLLDNIVYLGSLNASDIVQELQKANVCVVPSFVETYCLALAESLIIGCPTVCAYAGAMPEQAVDKEEALFYNPDDHIKCASLIEELIKDKELACRLSKASRKRKFQDNDREDVINTQIEIYDTILK